jgi:Macrocin-O-methyltransferase (TylF)/Coenzyme PQQ synthesis protein D (PqqD)
MTSEVRQEAENRGRAGNGSSTDRSIAPDDIILQPEQPAASDGADGYILEHPATQAYYRLNETSRRLWELVERPVSFGALCDQLVSEFDVGRPECEAYTRAFVSELDERGFVEILAELPGPAGLRRQYLELLKRALVNLIYVEHEMRMEQLDTQGLSGERLDDQRLLRDIRYRYPERYAKRLENKLVGASWFRKTPPYSQTAHTLIGLKRLDNLEYCARRVFADGVPGDFLEAGVCQGGASILLRALQVAFDEGGRTTWVADSFQGVPPPTSEPDRDLDLDLSEPNAPWMAISLEAVQDNFRTYNMLDDGVRFLPGWFSDTLPEAPIERLAILRLDGDLYESTRDVLDNLYDKVSPGGFVVVDDYAAYPPCRQAVEEFRAERGITARLRRIDWDGMYWQRDA